MSLNEAMEHPRREFSVGPSGSIRVDYAASSDVWFGVTPEVRATVRPTPFADFRAFLEACPALGHKRTHTARQRPPTVHLKARNHLSKDMRRARVDPIFHRTCDPADCSFCAGNPAVGGMTSSRK